DPADDWANEIFRSGKRTVSPLYVAPSGIHYVVVGYPIRDNAQQLVGALGFFVNLKVIQDSLGALPISDGSVVTVADPAGHILARSADADRFVGELLPAELRPVTEIREPIERTGIDGTRRMYGEAR